MMNAAADHLYTLHRNAFALAPVIQSFYLNREPLEKDILLSYLVLPLVSFPAMQDYLHTANRTSSIRTMTSEASRLVGLPLRISEYKPITNKALLILRSDESLQLRDDLSVIVSENQHSENADPKMLRCARQLAMVFRNESVVTIYRLLGLKSL
ncbi:three component ABC system middle component [Roseateles sp. DC23W]|uniref:Three component ABC system middle component n=1 Tax=Pelomonas dachongensis TaxID=3299029 RepID=A0ABW7EWM7_9BURK